MSSTSAFLDIDAVRPLGARVLVRRYEKPESVRGILIPRSYAHDDTLSLWEVVRSTAQSDDAVGATLLPDDIVQTRPWRGVALGDGTHFFINAHDILNVIPWKEREDE